MLEFFFEKIERLFLQFTLRRFFAVIFPFLLFLTALFIFEIYTSHFRLKKLEKATAILSMLHKINEADSLQNNEMLLAIHSNLILELQKTTQPEPLAPPVELVALLKPNISSLHSGFWKFIFGSSPWLIILAIVLVNPKHMYITRKLLIFILFSGILAIVFPEFWWPIGNLAIYPIGNFLVIFMISALLEVTSKGK
ncbi:MAG: hypothetical protein FVQ80_10185 [Planctomycetes bacterium]|nr:hypothetical protein [Planctomycetota bacterium]